MKTIDFRKDLLPLKDKIFRTALRITLNVSEAEDVTQDTLVKLWSRREELAGVDNLEAYCIAAGRNLALDLVSRCEHATETLEPGTDDPADSAPDPEERAEREDRLRQVHEIFCRLPEKQRTALQLRDIEGMSYTEAAQAMGVSETDFKVTLHRARQTVRNRYEKLESYGL